MTPTEGSPLAADHKDRPGDGKNPAATTAPADPSATGTVPRNRAGMTAPEDLSVTGAVPKNRAGMTGPKAPSTIGTVRKNPVGTIVLGEISTAKAGPNNPATAIARRIPPATGEGARMHAGMTVPVINPVPGGRNSPALSTVRLPSRPVPADIFKPL
jgi:hypothetical protein